MPDDEAFQSSCEATFSQRLRICCGILLQFESAIPYSFARTCTFKLHTPATIISMNLGHLIIALQKTAVIAGFYWPTVYGT